jgi:hypothetical protein
MTKEIKKGEAWRRGYMAGEKDALAIPLGVSKWKQHGIENGYWDYFEAQIRADYKDICTKCRGKGYGTSLEFAEGGGKRWKLPVIKYCDCSRGQQLKELYTEKINVTKKKRGKI